jgi:putrescine transport system ATP-binding protein
MDKKSLSSAVSSSSIYRYPWQDPKEVPFIRIKNVSKSFGSLLAIDNLSLDIYKGEFFSILGSSGCGKTTLLRLLGAFDKPSLGSISIDGIDVTQTPAYQLPVNMMFQSYALFPHMTIFDNIAFGLKQKNLPKKIIKERVEEMLDLVKMNNFGHRKPNQLSGGQRQRAALARALAPEPSVLLLDEPLAALDKTLRESTQFELVNIQEKLGITFLMITHDQEEAMTMSTRIALMEQGRIKQIGTPGEIYEYPNSLAVAQFIGSINIFEGIVVGEEADYMRVQCPDLNHELAVAYSASVPIGAHVFVAVRPEKMIISDILPQSEFNVTQGIVREIAYLGDVSIYHVHLPSGKVVMATQSNSMRLAERPVTWDNHVYLNWSFENSLMLTV